MTPSGSFRAVAAPVAGALLLLWTSAAAFGQQGSSLGEIAKKEEERRKKIAVPAKVYTNKDLPKAAVTPPQPRPVSGAGASTAPSAAQKPVETPKPPEPQKPEERREEKDESWWRARITSARTELQRSEMAAEAFQSRVNALTNDFAARDDPYQRAQIAIDRQKTLNELERVKSEIVRLKQSIAGIEEEARVAGVPPGWLR